MIVYLDSKFNKTSKEKAVIRKVIPKDGSRPYFTKVSKTNENNKKPEN